MFFSHDLGASLYRTWTDEQRIEEVRKLVEGHRNGLPTGILCSMSEAISGSREKAREQLLAMLSEGERRAAVEGETGGMRILA
ncbi:MAG TPA: hypothetical protein VNX25_08395, partial [Verrucomicrobiae bacterium]|nr:hypothetical protein [Verrucomicrobiae bacterium]